MERGERVEKMEKSEKMEKGEKENMKESGKGGTFLQVLSLILIIVLIVLMLIVVQVPYTTTNAVKETVPVEKCMQVDIPFISNFRTGLTYDTSSKIYSSEGQALYRYSELKTYLFANIRNMGEEKGAYCLNAQAYLIENFTNNGDSLALFQNLISSNSNKVQTLENWSGNLYTYPVCTESTIPSTDTDIISLWTPAILSADVQEQNDLDNVYILFTVVPPISQQCSTVNVENITQQEVTRYCNAWKHVVGKC
jgi:hypothetical protein